MTPVADLLEETKSQVSGTEEENAPEPRQTKPTAKNRPDRTPPSSPAAAPPHLLESIRAMVGRDTQDVNILTGPEKAAILIASLGVDISSEVLQLLSDEEIEDVVLALSKLRAVGTDVRDSVFQEAYELSFAGDSLQFGSMYFVRQLLARLESRTEGQAVADSISTALDQWRRGIRGQLEEEEELDEQAEEQTHEGEEDEEEEDLELSAFDLATRAEPAQLATFLADEHPQAVAFVLSLLDVAKAGLVMAALPEELRGQAAVRVAKMERINPRVAKQVENELERKLSHGLRAGRKAAAGGVSYLVSLLSQVDRGAEKAILDSLQQADRELSDQVRSRLFTFDNIGALDDRSIQRILRDVNKQDLVLALKGASEEMQNKVWKNMSTRAAQMLQEELAFMGPTRIANVYEAQKRIVDVVRALEDAEEIFIQREGQAEFL